MFDENEESVFLSIYNMTYRYDPDLKWLDRLQATFKDLDFKGKGTSPEKNDHAGETNTSPSDSTSLTRVSVWIFDFNVDILSR